MLKNYLKIAIRNISRHKVYSLINISALAVALALFILALLYMDFNFSYDKFQKNSGRIYCLTGISKSGSENLWAPGAMLQTLLDEVPDVENGTRMSEAGRKIVRYNEKKFYESGIWYADDRFFSIFSFKMIKGEAGTALSAPNSVVITESIAEKYFGDEDPIGKHLIFDNDITAAVTGVTEDVPINSKLKYSYLISMKTQDWWERWNNFCNIFILIGEGKTPEKIEEHFPAILDKNMAEYDFKPASIYLTPLTDLHLIPMHVGSPFSKTTPVQFYIMLGLAAALLVVVCLNFMNLSTARYINRGREVGIRKVAGAHKYQLVSQFLAESVITAFIALPAAIGVFMLIRSVFIAIMGPDLELTLSNKPEKILFIVAITFLVGIISGSYPAFFLSRFNPVQVMKGNLLVGSKGAPVRKLLVVSQFILTIILIVFAIVTNRQFDYLVNVDLGYQRDNVLTVRLHPEARPRLEAIREELLQYPEITHVCGAGWIPGDWGGPMGSLIIPEGMDEKDNFRTNTYDADYDFIETLNLELIKGRSFSREFNEERSMIITENLARQLKWENPLGKKIKLGDYNGIVIGVVKHFHFKHVFHKKMPALLYFQNRWPNYMLIRMAPGTEAIVNEYLKQEWNTIMPEFPLESEKLEDYFKWVFNSTVKGREFIGSFSIWAIFISCVGLLGLVSYTTERRTKEIGIRKVLGASVPGIVKMLLNESFILIILSNIIAWPLAYFVSKLFLNWAWVEKTGINLNIFIFAGLLSLVTGFLAVISRTLKAATANPIDSLKVE